MNEMRAIILRYFVERLNALSLYDENHIRGIYIRMCLSSSYLESQLSFPFRLYRLPAPARTRDPFSKSDEISQPDNERGSPTTSMRRNEANEMVPQFKEHFLTSAESETLCWTRQSHLVRPTHEV